MTGRTNVIDEIGAAIGEAAHRQGPAVVGLGRGWSLGSGVIVAPGRVLTSAHNLRHDEVTVTFGDGRRVPGRVAGSDPDLDVAVIEVDTGAAAPVTWPDADPPAIGRPVIALANPGGRGLRATLGFVSAGARSFRGPRGRRISGAIEHTAPLPRGSSGGPLLDTAGALIGINSLRSDGGLILAVPADAALRERVEALGRGEAPSRARLGVAIAPPRVARRMRRSVGLPERDGVLVRAVQDGSPAARAGLARGDLIVAAGGRTVDHVDVLYDALDAAAGGGRLELAIVRGTEERTVTVAFAEAVL
ncbi:MAG: trypsin-like peptidase domain-containing protein [Solirubrobacterales bacterium]|nr:trypsin-like peptidase domain-containing protein [Solirubrobacterales bacterium]MBV9715304.1 trypsin-like peptidase domain-containing protein [Solirubrobacterales bacterium]